MGPVEITYDEPDRTPAWGVEVNGGVIVGALWPHEGKYRWELYDQASGTVAFDCGEAPTMPEAKCQIQGAVSDRIASTIGCEICGREVAGDSTLCRVCGDLIDRQTEMLLEERHFGQDL